MIQAVAFDVGGVLTLSPIDEFTKVDTEYGLPAGTVQGFLRGGEIFAKVETGQMPVLDFHRQTAAMILADHGVNIPVQRLELMLENCMGNRLRPDVLALVSEVKAAGYKTALLTNIFAERREWLHGLFPDGTIDVFCDSSEQGLRKPDPAIYQRLTEMLGCDARNIAFIDDFVENLGPARDIGILDILFTTATETRAALVAAGIRIASKPPLAESSQA